LLGQAIKLLLITAAVQWSAPVPFELRRLVQLAVVFTAAYALGGAIGESGSLRQCLWQIVVAAATPIVVVAAGFLAKDEKARITAGLRRLFGLRTPTSAPLSENRLED